MSELPQTDWSMLDHLATGDEAQRSAALDLLVRRYWPAIYAYIRRTGRDVHESSDLTQGFITTVIVQRDLPARADAERGRFRSLLLRSLQNYLRERHRSESRRRERTGSPRPTGRGELDPFERSATEVGDFASPEAAFAYHWSAALIRRVLDRVRAGCAAEGLDTHWQLFEARVARPMLFGDPASDLPTLARRFNVPSTAKASNMIVTVKRRFARMMLEEVRTTIGTGESPEEEIAALLDDLRRGRSDGAGAGGQ